MKITRILSARPELCSMTIKGFFGGVKGEVKYDEYQSIEDNRTWYVITENGKEIGGATNFLHACDFLLTYLKIIHQTVAR